MCVALSGMHENQVNQPSRLNMGCPFAGSFFGSIMAVLFLLSTFLCVSFADKEPLLKSDEFWDSESITSDSGWIIQEKTALSCSRSKVSTSLYLKRLKTQDANRVFVEIKYEIDKTLSSNSNFRISSNFIRNGKALKMKGELGFERTDVLGTTATNGSTKKTLHYDVDKKEVLLNLTLRARKVCVTVLSIRVYYYVCPKNKTLMVNRTVAPSTGVVNATVNCDFNVDGNDGSVVVAQCENDGKWTKISNKDGCKRNCEPGTEPLNSACMACKNGYYKEKSGIHGCSKCPENTLSNTNKTVCVCKENHYRKGDIGPCLVIPKKPQHLKYDKLSHNVILLRWNVTDGIKHFHVKCSERLTETLSIPCHNSSIDVRGKNVSETFLKIDYLKENVNYTFTVASVNDISGEHASLNVFLSSKAITTQTTRFPSITAGVVTSSTFKRKTSKTTVVADNDSRSSTDKPTIKELVSTAVINKMTSPTVGPHENENNKIVDPEDKNTELAPYIGIAIIPVILIIIVVIVFIRRRRAKKDIDIEAIPLNSCPETYIDPSRYGNPEKAVRKFAKEIDRREIKLSELIGEGEFAKVHKGTLTRMNEPSVSVAVKILKPGSTPKNREDFLTEAAVMGQFKDLNIVALEGVVTLSHPVMIITEFMHNGALSDFLVGRRLNRFSDVELLGMAKGVASGMKYLARMRFVHRDLAARNVLVNENMVCKVADFGLTRELEDSEQGEYVTQGGKIPIRWTAPEAYKHRRFTTASDVWSYGIVLWEIMSYAERPYGDWDNYMVMEKVTASYRLFAPTNCPKIVHQLMMECWKEERNQRPSFSDIVQMLERWIRNPYLLKDYLYVTEKDHMADRKSCVAKSIREHLEAIKMERYIDNFIDFGYTEIHQLYNITDDDLVNIGVPLVGHRNKIIKSIRGDKELVLPLPVDV
ncbi:ephrin type-B receptor 1-B-like isoform X1 [Xenia sp. Carnegie-2017]|uniref:ephrin type-B receptor 1-B-like isoform X1 n=1 Tax=Xenia sp. Carnegie-2017 TaxID=2897299 RepID=UPI001F0387B3|nr:ephrin type-B receptor 1-B-like isoform X1 [Xenia sp. Carnegie-2017]